MATPRVRYGDRPDYEELNALSQALLGQELPPGVEVAEEPVASFRWPDGFTMTGDDEAPPKVTP